uniref:Large ribosomal subunit protein eL28 n=1 Tax=Phlebotomus papatasi TaxID=29031 RepID=A0A1B0DIX5_PHLPP
MASSSHLNWLIVRNCNSYLLKKRNIPKPFSTERNNLTNLSSYRYSGLVHHKTLAVLPADKKGFTVVYKKKKVENQPSKSLVKVTMKSGPRRSLYKLKKMLKAQKYRKDLTKAALRRASAVLRSQRPRNTKKAKKAKKTE